MPGDPLRAKMIAENFLTDVECFNQTRGMLGYTGNYQGKRVSVMGHGMGIPSIGIYTYELFSFYDVENIIRIGSIGGLDTSLNLGDVIIAQGACTDSNYASQYGLPGTFARSDGGNEGSARAGGQCAGQRYVLQRQSRGL